MSLGLPVFWATGECPARGCMLGPMKMTLGITLCPDKNTDFFPLEKAKMGNENGEYRSWNDNFLGLKIPIPRELN